MKKFINGIKKVAQAIAPGVDWLHIPPATYARYILMIVATINSVLMAVGLSPIDVSEDKVTFIVSIVFNILIMIVNTYKDNPTSKEGTFAATLRNNLKSMNVKDAASLITKIRILMEHPEATINYGEKTEAPSDNTESPGILDEQEETVEDPPDDNIEEEDDEVDHMNGVEASPPE